MKRFTETQKWDDPWFRQLVGVHKLVFLYVIDRCDNAGFLELDMDGMAWHTKISPEHLEGALKGLERGIKGASGWLWVRMFLRHQKNEPLNPENPAHKQIIALIKSQTERFKDIPEFQIFLAPLMGLLSPIGIGIGKGTGKKIGDARGKGKPTREEAEAYGTEIGMKPDEINRWYDHFESNGWRVGGKSPMRDFKAAMRIGKERASEFALGKTGKPKQRQLEAAPKGEAYRVWTSDQCPYTPDEMKQMGMIK